MSKRTKPSALAQLCAIHIKNGITSTKALADETGYSDRAIRLARAELECRKPASARKPAAGSPLPPGSPLPAAECRSGPRSRARIETPSGLVIPKGLREDPPFPPSSERVALASGKLTICAELREFWIGEFGGDAKRLDLALIQAAGYVQTASSRPLEAQVASQLARMAADKREKDQRYRDAVARNATAKPKKSTHMARY